MHSLPYVMHCNCSACTHHVFLWWNPLWHLRLLNGKMGRNQQLSPLELHRNLKSHDVHKKHCHIHVLYTHLLYYTKSQKYTSFQVTSKVVRRRRYSRFQRRGKSLSPVNKWEKSSIFITPEMDKYTKDELVKEEEERDSSRERERERDRERERKKERERERKRERERERERDRKREREKETKRQSEREL